jgi:hypothetical protein
MQSPASFILLYLVFPVWVAAGFIDWLCHRRTDIAHTSGLKENLLHLLMFGEVGLGMLVVALFEVNALVLLIVAVVFVAHEVTVYWDLDYSTLRRDVGPFEQMVHSFLELLPLISLALLALLDWPQARALVGLGDVAADWSLRPKQEPFPPSYLLGAAGAAFVFNALPLLQETWACIRAARGAPAAKAKGMGATARVEPAFDPDLRARTPRPPGPR